MNSRDLARPPGPAAAPRPATVAPPVPTAGRAGPAAAQAATVPTATSDPPGQTIVHVHIERLTLEGIANGDVARLTHALRSRLTELVGSMAEPPWQLLPAADRIDGGVLPEGSGPEAIGRHIAGQIVRGLGRTGNDPDERSG